MSLVGQLKSKSANRLGRSDRSAVGRWFWEIDRVLLFFVAVLIAIGLVAVAAASPASARRLKIDDLHFLWGHLVYQAVGIAAMATGLFVPRDLARRVVTGARRRIAAAEDIAIGLGFGGLCLRGCGILLRIVVSRRRIVIAAIRRTRGRRRWSVIVIVRRVAGAVGQIGRRCIRRLRHRGCAQQGNRQGGDKRCTEH